MQTPHTPPLIFPVLRLSDRLTAMLNLPIAPVVDLKQLRHCPVGSFGQAVVTHFEQHQLQPFKTGLRRKQLHDVVHVLTGYGVDPIGEAEVQAFLLGAKWRLIQIVVGLGTMRLVRQCQPEITRRQLRDRLRDAYDRGRGSHFDPDSWQPEQFWSVPLEQVRQHYQV